MSNNSKLESHVPDFETGLGSPYLLVVSGSLQLLTLPMLSLLCKILHQRIQIRHPVYALIYQDVWFLLTSNAICVFSLPIFMFGGLSSHYLEFMAVISVGALHFHQVSWLAVTTLRFYLLTKSHELEDLKRLTMPCLLLAWTLAVLFGVFFYTVRYVILALFNLNPDKYLTRSSDLWVRMFINFLAMFISNLPDFGSIATYVFLYRHTKHQEANEVEVFRNEEEDDGPYFEGIYIGGPINDPIPEKDQQNIPGQVLELRSASAEDNGNEDNEDASREQLSSGSNSVERATPSHEHIEASFLPPSPQTPEEAKCAIQALRLHAITCLVDLVLVPLLFTTVDKIGYVPAAVVAIVDVYWLPIACTLRNFGKITTVIKEAVEDVFDET